MSNKIKKELDIALTQQDWKKYKQMCNKSSCKKYKDPSEVFLLGLETMCNAY